MNFQTPTHKWIIHRPQEPGAGFMLYRQPSTLLSICSSAEFAVEWARRTGLPCPLTEIRAFPDNAYGVFELGAFEFQATQPDLRAAAAYILAQGSGK